jgi:hypothetical protein
MSPTGVGVGVGVGIGVGVGEADVCVTPNDFKVERFPVYVKTATPELFAVTIPLCVPSTLSAYFAPEVTLPTIKLNVPEAGPFETVHDLVLPHAVTFTSAKCLVFVVLYPA